MDKSIRLRALEPADAEFMYKAENEHTVSLSSDNAAPYSLRMLREYAETYDADPFRSGQLRLVATSTDGEPVGLLDFYDISARDRHACIACMLLPEYRGLGLAPVMLKAGINFAIHSLGLITVKALIHTDNLPSFRAFKSAGFVDAGMLKNWHFSDGVFKDVTIMQFLST